MMKGKKILSLVLAVLFLLPGLGVGLTASAEVTVTFSVVPDETTAYPGDTITYSVYMDPVADLDGLQLTLGLPDGLTFGQADTNTNLLKAMPAEFSINFSKSTLTLLIYTISPSEHFTSTENGVLLTFTCTVDDDASGEKTIDLPKHIITNRTIGGTVPTAYDPAGSAVTIMPAPPVKAIELVTGGAAANIAGAQKSSVYFGNYKQSSDGGDGYNVDPVKWRVLSNADGKLFLLSDQNLDAGVYYERYFTVTWETSTIRAWLNGTGEFSEENFKDSAFSAGEDAAVCVTDVSNPDSVFDDRTVPGGNDTADKVFLLSRDEAMNTAYGFTNDIEPTDTRVSINTAYTGSGGSNYGWTGEGGSADYWWLRSPGSADDRAAIVFETGQLNPGGYDVPNRSIAVRPAMNVDLGKVLFTSPAVGGKQGDGLTAVGNYNYYGSEWKLTLLDDSRQFAVTQTASGGSATVTNGYNTGSVTGGTDVQSQPAVTTAPGKTVSFSYNGATVGENEYVSAILTDEDGAALYYGRLAQPTDEEGTVTVTIPADLAPGDYTLMLFSEQYNGDKKTDLASAPINVALTVKARVPGDVNKDGQLDMADVLAILYCMTRIGEPEIDVQDADVNGNSEIDGGDAEMIQEYLAGQIDSLNGQKPDRPTGNNHVTENPEVTCAFTDADGSSEVTVRAGEKTTIPVSVILSGGSDKIYALDMQFKCSDGIRITGFLKEEEDNQGTFYQLAGIVTNDSTLRANADRVKGWNAGNGLKTFTLLVEVPADAAAGSTYTVDFDDLCQVFKFNKKGARELFTTAVIPLTINIKADPSKKAIRLVPNGSADYIKGAQESSVWFGNYKQSSDGGNGYNVDPVKWRVLSNADGKLFLLSDQNLDVLRYNEEGTSVTWATCTLRTWLNGYDGNPYGDSFIGSAFSDKEAAAIAQTAVVNDNNPSNNTPGGNDTADKVFLLSIAEAKTTAYGFTDNNNSTNTRVATNTAYVASGGHTGGCMLAVGEAAVWWLRSPGDTDNIVGYVMKNGTVAIGDGTSSILNAVRPAFWLDLNKVLFASAAENGKVGSGLTAVENYTGSDWKLTLLDESRSGFTAKCTNIENGVYTVQYSGAATGTNEKISAMIVSADGAVTYYGVLEAAKAGENTLTLDVNGKLSDGDKLYVFNEQVNGDKKTDCASALVDVTELFRYKAGDTLEYGTYPQSEVTDAATVAALNAKLRNNGWISYGYYIGTGGSNGEMAPDDFMRYQDIVLDGAKYRAVTFDCYRPYLTKNVSSAANSKQDENGYEPGNTYWFKFEPVTWKVLDPDSGLVLCIGAIDAQAYHNYIILDSDNDEYWGNADPVQKYRANDYAHSDIRAWLNEDFINTAFSTAQQENIKVSELDDASTYGDYDYESSADKIFLLSTDEAANGAYGFDPKANSMDTARQMSPSDYAKCQGIEAIALNAATKASFWWLREYFGNEAVNGVTPVGIAGSFSVDPFVTSLGVVPALRMQELQDDPTGAPLKVAMEIANYDELKAFASAVNGGQTGLKAILKSDIAATDKEWTPIGNELKPYVGIFDGDGHTITGLSNEDVANAPINAGLFGWLGENAKVKNVRLTGVDLKATYYLGAVAGDAKGAEITNCRNTGEINCTASQVGGIIGSIRGAIVSNCCNTGDITSTANNAYVGGIAGFLCGNQSAAGITNCYNTGTVTGKGRYSNVGGIAGYANDRNCTVEIANCYNTGAVTATGTSSRAGGIAASSCVFSGGTVEVINCYSAGAVTADQNAGGVIGLKYDSVVRNCYYDSDVCGLSSAIGKIDDTDDVKGLHTDEMTGASALTQMPFSDPSAWLVKGTTNLYEFYPHLKGFDFNADGSQKEASAIDAADWPAKIAHSHTYGEPVWSWEKDHSKAKATFTCSGCGDEQTVTDEEIDVTVVSAADCTNDRVVTYTAGVTFAGAPYENAVKNVTLPDTATGHTYGDTGDDRFTCTVCGAEDAARKAAAALADAKAAAKTELENYKDPADYRPAQQDELTAAVDAGKSDIDAAADIDAVNTALTAAKAVIDAIKTDAQLAAEELAADTAAADAVEAKIDAIGTVEFTAECNAKITAARAVYEGLTDAQKNLVTNYDKLAAAEAAYALLTDKAAFEQYKTDQKKAAEDKALDGDSDECAALIEAAKKTIDDVTYDESKPLDENKQAVDTAANLDQLAADLTDRRAADEVEKKINDIGAVALTEESKQKIDDAREAYNNLTDAQKALVGNEDTLKTAEEVYQLLEDKDNFEQYKDELKQAAEDKRKDGDSAESKKLIDDAVAAIDATDYDESKSLDENKAAIDAAADLDELTEQLEEHREIHYAVFKADGAEVARVPFTIDTKAITAPAVPVKGGYTGAWPKYELKAGGVEINAVYTKNDALVITDNAKEQGEGRVLTFKETVTFTTDTAALPEGATLCWYVNGEAVTAEKSVTVEAPKDDYTVQVKAFAKDGTLYAESDVLTVKVDHSFWAKLVYFFNLAFGPVTDAVKKVVPSFFSFLAALIKAFAAALVNAVKTVI